MGGGGRREKKKGNYGRIKGIIDMQTRKVE